MNIIHKTPKLYPATDLRGAEKKSKGKKTSVKVRFSVSCNYNGGISIEGDWYPGDVAAHSRARSFDSRTVLGHLRGRGSSDPQRQNIMSAQPIIHRHNITLKTGHALNFFFNEDSGLLVVDVVHKNERGGNEIIRRTINPSKLVAFAAKLPEEVEV